MHIYTHPDCISHEVAPGHPERADRLIHLMARLDQTGLLSDHTLLTASAADNQALLRAHPQSYLDDLAGAQQDEDLVPLDPDTWMGPHSLSAARHAAGAACDAVSAVLTGRTQRAFCAVRPPGHHAERNQAMGFCLFNSIAVGALSALAEPQVERVAILDFDVHHGNGTVDIFRDDPRVLVCSSFQHPHYPNRLYDIERPHIINTPLSAGSDGEVFRRALETQWPQAVANHQPDLILVSAGFDAHQLDPLANLNLTEADFRWATELIVQLANECCEGRVVSTLEGGYDLAALASSVEVHLDALA